MSEPTCSQPPAGRDAASLIFNLPGHDVIEATDLPLGGRSVVVQAVDRDEACPECGVISARVHAWTRQRVKDIPGPEGADPPPARVDTSGSASG